MTAQAAIPNSADIVSPAKLAHIVLRTSDAKPMVDWYCTVLGARIAMANPMIAFLTYDDEHHRIAIAALPGLKPAEKGTIGLEHVAFTYETPDQLFATYERLQAAGIEPYWTINHGPTISFYYRDPDGNQVELQIDIFPDNESTDQWFATSDFSVNPIGVKFDPADLIARYRAGDDPASLFARPVIEPIQILAQLPAQ